MVLLLKYILRETIANTRLWQAPTAPKKRPSIRAKSSNSGSGLIARPPPKHREGAVISDSFINSKKDKRVIKHSFLNRIEKAHKKPLKRRRPSKKLVTTLESLADALPDVEELVKENERAAQGGSGNGKMAMKSLKSKPGARKRKEKLERMERERFGKNLAVILAGGKEGEETVPEVAMAVDDGEGADASATATATTAPASNPAVNRFAALRAWVNQNMEKHPAFEEKK